MLRVEKVRALTIRVSRNLPLMNFRLFVDQISIRVKELVRLVEDDLAFIVDLKVFLDLHRLDL